MISALKRLMQGKADMIAKFVAAEAFWREFFDQHRNDDKEALSKALIAAQDEFAAKLDWETALAQDIMPYTCLTHLWDEGSGIGDNRELAERMLAAFRTSRMEVSTSAEMAAKLFYLDE